MLTDKMTCQKHLRNNRNQIVKGWKEKGDKERQKVRQNQKRKILDRFPNKEI